jgi:hypothetical protein
VGQAKASAKLALRIISRSLPELNLLAQAECIAIRV